MEAVSDNMNGFQKFSGYSYDKVEGQVRRNA